MACARVSSAQVRAVRAAIPHKRSGAARSEHAVKGHGDDCALLCCHRARARASACDPALAKTNLSPRWSWLHDATRRRGQAPAPQRMNTHPRRRQTAIHLKVHGTENHPSRQNIRTVASRLSHRATPARCQRDTSATSASRASPVHEGAVARRHLRVTAHVKQLGGAVRQQPLFSASRLLSFVPAAAETIRGPQREDSSHCAQCVAAAQGGLDTATIANRQPTRAARAFGLACCHNALLRSCCSITNSARCFAPATTLTSCFFFARFRV